MLKYELIKEDNLYRIKALKSFSDVKKGQLGGLVEGEYNLSHYGDCWIYHNSKVTGGLKVSGNAQIMNSSLTGSGLISGSIIVIRCFFDTFLTELSGCGIVKDTQVLGFLKGSDFSYISKVYVNPTAKLIIRDMSRIDGVLGIKGHVSVTNKAHININQRVVIDSCKIIGNVLHPFDKITFIQTERRMVTLYKRKDVYYCDIGCQTHMTLKDLENRIEEDGGMSPHRMVYVNIMKLASLLL